MVPNLKRIVFWPYSLTFGFKLEYNYLIMPTSIENELPEPKVARSPSAISIVQKLASSSLLVGTVLIAACSTERTNPAKYNLDLNGSADLFLVNNPEFQTLATFISPLQEEGNQVWAPGTSRLRRTNPFSEHWGTLTFLTKEDYNPNAQGQIVRGLLMTDSLKILTIDDVKTHRAADVIPSRFLAPENTDRLVLLIDFEDPDGNIGSDISIGARLYTHNVDSSYFQTIPGSQRTVEFIPDKLTGSKS